MELLLLQSLRHPNIVEFLGAVTKTDPLVIVTEYLPNVSKFAFQLGFVQCVLRPVSSLGFFRRFMQTCLSWKTSTIFRSQAVRKHYLS